MGPPASVSGDLVAKYLRPQSDFSYDSATNRRGGLVTIKLVLEDIARAPGERVSLLHQVHVDNAP